MRVKETRDDEVPILAPEMVNRCVRPRREGDGGKVTNRQHAAGFGHRDRLHPRYAHIACPKRCVRVTVALRPPPYLRNQAAWGSLAVVFVVAAGFSPPYPSGHAIPPPFASAWGFGTGQKMPIARPSAANAPAT